MAREGSWSSVRAGLSPFLQALTEVLDPFVDLGWVKMWDGTLLLGHLADASGAEWFVADLYAGLSEDELSTVERLVQQPLPESLRELYRDANGMQLFAAHQFSVFGLRREVPAGRKNRQPKPIATIHHDIAAVMPSSSSRREVFFADYFGGAQSFVFSARADGAVTARREGGDEPVQEWESPKAMALDAARRLAPYYGANGWPRDRRVDEVPVLFED